MNFLHASRQTRCLFVIGAAAALAVLPASCAGGPKARAGQTLGVAPEKAPPPMTGHNLILNESFNDPKKSLPWNGQFTEPAAGRIFIDKSELCTEITNRGTSGWSAQMRHQHLTLQKGHTYAIQFKMHASQKTRLQAKVAESGPPYREYWKMIGELDTTPQVFSGTLTMVGDDDPSVEMALNLGGVLAKGVTMPFTVCADDVHIDDPQFTAKPIDQGAPIPDILVNQVGYFPRLIKLATLKSPGAVPWELYNARNEKVAFGTSAPFGPDAASGDQVSIIDFSSYTEPGTGYTLKAGGATSHPFDIRNDLYSRLKYDALAFYYQQRSGIEIKMPYAVDPQLVHAAGHIGVKPNHGDVSVGCFLLGCSYKLDVSGGWYDAGDQGKYVVNGGISVWTLLNWWERTRAFGTSAADFGDGKMNIPEAGNGVPDLLDEARWELEFELKMQVPEGQPLAGMVHHKIHDGKFTALSVWPSEDPMDRYLYPPSTAATLNLAANAAQAARIWHSIDKPFAAKCLAAAERAWTAAQANPEIYAKPGGEGGGAYDDGKVIDDFYWAAAELYLTTNKLVYKDFITKSEFYKKVTADWGDDNPGMHTSMTWADTQSLGSISLILTPNGLPPKDLEEIKKNIVAAADNYLALAMKEGYRLPFSLPQKGYPWGSNSFVATNSLMMALAHDLTHDPKYLNGVVLGMDYLLGRNPMDQSYVTGYGKRPLQNPYHRFWCYQANNKFPKPPPGVLSGGPNSGMEDPYVQAAGIKGNAPQKCFIDNGEAWSANEVTINWNAPLAWIAAYLDEAAGPGAVKGEGKAETKKPASAAASAKGK